MTSLDRAAPHQRVIKSLDERLARAHETLKDKLVSEQRRVDPHATDLHAAPFLPPALSGESLLKDLESSGALTADWFTAYIPRIYEGLQTSRQTFHRYLEIGSYEGLSTCWFARYLSQQSNQPSVTAIDLFCNIPGRGLYEHRFDHNVGTFVKNVPVRKIKSRSELALSSLISEGKAFDLIYVDGSHAALDVLVDAALCWRLLRPGGVILFDDYFLIHDYMPRGVLEGLNAFLDLIRGEYEVIKVYSQVMLQRKPKP